jgi:3-oxoadipate enol-lactonase
MHILVNGAHLFVEDAGNPAGMPVVFVHGFPFSHAMWDEQVRVAGTRHRTISYDVRGHGRSDVGDGQYTIEGHVDDLLALLKEVHVDRPVVVGLSMGGYITLRALERDQERFRAAVLCDTRSEADTNEAKLRRFSVVSAVKRIGSEAFGKEFVKAVFAPGAEHRVPAAVTMIHSTIAHTPPLSIAGTQLALASRTDTTSSLPHLTLPVLILVGEHDQTTPVSAAQAMHALIPGSRLAVVPNAAHMSNLENPEFFNRQLLEFLAGLDQ